MKKQRGNVLAYSLVAACVLSAAPASGQSAARLTPFLKLEKLAGEQAIPANTYTKLEIVADGSTDTVIGYKKRDLLWRIGIAKKYSFNSILKVDVGDFIDTIPLVTREYESSSKAGETFSRTVTYDDLGFPYFLAGSDVQTRVARFSVDADMAETTNSQAASLSLSFMREALKAVAPASGIVTSLTKDSSKAVADKIDDQASKLFGTTVGEELMFDIGLGEADAYRITVFGPVVETDELMDKGEKTIGVWTVRFAKPKPSIFSTETCADQSCDGAAAYRDATRNPAYVLAFKLVDRIGELGTIKAYLRQQEWWSGDMQAMEATQSGDDPQFGRFCRKIRDAIAELGLNDLDGRVVAASVANSGLVSGKVKRGMEAQPARGDCSLGVAT